MAIYENIKHRCKDKKTSVLSLENELGFARGRIYKWNDSPPSVKKVQAVAERLGCSIDELIGDKYEANT